MRLPELPDVEYEKKEIAKAVLKSSEIKRRTMNLEKEIEEAKNSTDKIKLNKLKVELSRLMDEKVEVENTIETFNEQKKRKEAEFKKSPAEYANDLYNELSNVTEMCKYKNPEEGIDFTCGEIEKNYIVRCLKLLPKKFVDIASQEGLVVTALDEGTNETQKMKSRPFYNNYGTYIALSYEYSYDSAMHEYSHFIEDRIDGLKEKVIEFYERRTKGCKVEKLSNYYSPNEVEDNEYVKADNFVDPYIGKVYSDDETEVLSMGITMAYYEPRKLALDPDYESFIYGVLTLFSQ